MNDRSIQMESLIDLGIKMFATQSLEKLVDFVLYNVIGLFGTSPAALFTFDPEKKEFSLKASRATGTDFVKSGWSIKSKELHDHLTASDELLRFSEVVSFFPDNFEFEFIQSLKHKNKLIGILLLGSRPENQSFSKREKKLLSVFGSQIATALQNNLLYEELRKKNKILKETQQELVQSAKLAAIGKLAAGVAHEINNPLVSMNGYTRLLKKKSEDPELQEYTEILEEEIDRCKNIVQDLLKFARQGKDSSFKTFNLKDPLNNCLQTLAPRLENKKISVNTVFPEKQCKIEGDPDQIYQVFLNLLVNALEAVKPSNGRIEVKIESGPGSHLVTISDNGPGIPEDIKDKIFDPFFTTKDAGTGLGLSIVYNILDIHGGEISLHSDSSGTEFELEFKTGV